MRNRWKLALALFLASPACLAGCSTTEGDDVVVADHAFTAAGKVDTTYGVGGTAELGPSSGIFLNPWVHADRLDNVLELSDGRLLLLSFDLDQKRSLVTAVDPAGTIDKSFGTDGVVELDGSDYHHAFVTPSGKIVLHSTERGLVRLMANGALDASFGDAGRLSTFAPNLAAVAYVNLSTDLDGSRYLVVKARATSKLAGGADPGKSDLHVFRVGDEGDVSPLYTVLNVEVPQLLILAPQVSHGALYLKTPGTRVLTQDVWKYVDGKLDLSYGERGHATIDDPDAHLSWRRPTGGLLMVTGSTSRRETSFYAIDESGKPDLNFGTDGRAEVVRESRNQGLVQEPEGGLLRVAISSEWGFKWSINRLNPNQSAKVDNSFSLIKNPDDRRAYFGSIGFGKKALYVVSSELRGAERFYFVTKYHR